ncbi:uncharacterized protein LOC124648626 [Lolium rigidum]|uniref:uncharacterized protein LOC124648626 n=1 Tax=Lolium rigidum TaxID=89674 RepID=UPI001F5D01C0|nr:uncharacterized protein LOC124648626 [Lolium rigidum]
MAMMINLRLVSQYIRSCRLRAFTLPGLKADAANSFLGCLSHADFPYFFYFASAGFRFRLPPKSFRPARHLCVICIQTSFLVFTIILYAGSLVGMKVGSQFMAMMIKLRLVSQYICSCRLRAFALPGLRADAANSFLGCLSHADFPSVSFFLCASFCFFGFVFIITDRSSVVTSS